MHASVVVLRSICIGYLLSIDNGNQFPFYLLPTLLFFLSSLLFFFGLSTFPAVRLLIAFDNRIEIGCRNGTSYTKTESNDNKQKKHFNCHFWLRLGRSLSWSACTFWQWTIYVFLRAPIDRQIDFCSSMIINTSINRTLLEGIVGIGGKGKMNCCLSVRMQQAICIIYLLLEMSTWEIWAKIYIFLLLLLVLTSERQWVKWLLLRLLQCIPLGKALCVCVCAFFWRM